MTDKTATKITNKERTADATERLKLAIEGLGNSDKYRQFLRDQAVFWKYSWRNTLIIQKQRPGATMVRTFRAWEKLGRKVMSGEKALYILGPVPITKMVEDKNGNEVDRSWMTYRAIAVFDISQTEVMEGAKKPYMPKPATVDYQLTGDAGRYLYDVLKQHMIEEGCMVREYDKTRHGENGYYMINTHEIYILRRSNLAMLNTLIHEAAHHYTRSHDKYVDFGRAGEEVIVQSATFVVADHFGLDVEEWSAVYVKSWLGSDPKGFEKGLGEIKRLAEVLIDIMEAALAVDEEDEDDEELKLAA